VITRNPSLSGKSERHLGSVLSSLGVLNREKSWVGVATQDEGFDWREAR
jgi:hypothetical protein